ncbi:GGDEF domain-containing protein [uncultured Cohaesibacter sp.]|uniref:GGDEF domain-containing protein n=1 Tax=uncultured Cohaesibacter sp. TaxID=1002546 RepID=UPI0029C79CD5|nr:GGDEF domain-containing protein [uncultured Cohaesibacter sp.]
MSDEYLDGLCRYLGKIKTTGHMLLAAGLFATICSLLSLLSTLILFYIVDSRTLPWVEAISYLLPFSMVFCISYLLIRGFAAIHSKNEYLWEIAERDDLTRLLNRAGFLRRGSALAIKAERDMASLSMIMFDVDHFKTINDTRGHSAGDMALKHLAEILLDICRDEDVIARWGGEEFAIILPYANAQGAEIMAERLREKIARTPLLWKGKAVLLTISAGVTEWNHEGDCLEDMVERADKGLYLAKAAGRNRVQMFQSHLEKVPAYEQDVFFEEEQMASSAPSCASSSTKVA